MELKYLPHEQLEPYLRVADLLTLFPRYVCQQIPQAISPAIVHEAHIVGTVITGRDCGLPNIFSFWLWANNRQGAHTLLNHLKQQHGDDVCLNFPLQYADLVSQLFPTRPLTRDHLYILLPSQFRAQDSPYPVVPITPTSMEHLNLPDDIAARIGDKETLSAGMPLYGMIHDYTVIALGEAIADIGTSAAIQQVYTIEAYRGRGLGSAMVSSIAQTLIEQKKIPLYWVAEQNTASIRVTQKLGFELLIRLGCLD